MYAMHCTRVPRKYMFREQRCLRYIKLWCLLIKVISIINRHVNTMAPNEYKAIIMRKLCLVWVKVRCMLMAKEPRPKRRSVSLFTLFK